MWHTHVYVCVRVSCSEYVSWREEGGRFPDGRHFKNYYLIEAGTQREKLVITAEDSHRKDR